MAERPPSDVTTLLADLRAGSAAAREQLAERVYAELHRLAQELMASERPGHTLQPTALVNEAMARLLSRDVLVHVPDRAYLFAAAAQTMRQVLVDHARRRKATKRGGNQQRIPLDDVVEGYERERVDLCALDEALEVLAARSQRQSQVVVLRFFGGLSMSEIAENLGVSLGTVEKDWRIARAWLRRQLGGRPRDDAGTMATSQ